MEGRREPLPGNRNVSRAVACEARETGDARRISANFGRIQGPVANISISPFGRQQGVLLALQANGLSSSACTGALESQLLFLPEIACREYGMVLVGSNPQSERDFRGK